MQIALVMVTDERGYALARYAMASALLTQADDVTPHLMLDGWDGPPETDGLFRLARRLGKPIRVTRFDDESLKVSNLRTAAHITSTTYRKLAAMDMLSADYDRALYADIDILFFEPISIATIDFAGQPLAAVHDLADCNQIDSLHPPVHHPDRTHRHYFNAGLMAFDFENHELSVLREQYRLNCERHLAGCSIYLDCKCGDQCPLNMTFADKWTPLPLTWNIQTYVLQTPTWAKASVRHYTGAKKFLPIRALRADRRERAFIRAIAVALEDDLPGEWPGMDLIYWANSVRRSRARSRANAAVAVIEAGMQDRHACVTP